MYKLYI